MIWPIGVITSMLARPPGHPKRIKGLGFGPQPSRALALPNMEPIVGLFAI